MPRIGIYAGTFDPVHAGHITFALQSLKAAQLDKIYFLPERRPRAKQHVEHFGHRVAMLKHAVRPHSRLDIIELVDVSFNVEKTLPRLQKKFPDAQLIFLLGSDVARTLNAWPKAEKLLAGNEFVIGLRHDDKREDLHSIVESWPAEPKTVTVFPSYAPEVSSGRIREALRLRKKVPGVLKSVERYSDNHWLYVSLA